MAYLETLLEQRARAWDASQAIRERLDGDDYVPTAEDEKSLSKALDEVEELTRQIETAERERRLAALDYTPHAAPRTPEDERTPDEQVRMEKRYTKDFSTYLRSGRVSTQLAEGYRAQGTTSGGVGGYLVPTGFRRVLMDVMKAYGGLQPLADSLETTEGNAVPWPVVDDTANSAAYVDENVDLGAGTDLAFTQVSLGAPTFGVAPIKVSFQLLQDSAFDLDTFIPQKMGMRFGRKVASELVNGATANKIVGLLVKDATGAAIAADVKFPVGTVAAGITADSVPTLFDLEHSLDPAYRANARWLISDLALARVRRLVDTTKRPLWEPSLQAGIPDRLLGYPITIDQAMPNGAAAANAKFAAFGDFSQSYIVRTVRDVISMRLVEAFATSGQVGYIAFLRLDGKPTLRQAWKLLAYDAT